MTTIPYVSSLDNAIMTQTCKCLYTEQDKEIKSNNSYLLPATQLPAAGWVEEQESLLHMVLPQPLPWSFFNAQPERD